MENKDRVLEEMCLIRVMVVDDSAFMRRVITKIIEKDSQIKVIETAQNGIEAVEKSKNHNIDVITMDVKMPKMDGLEATKQIMKNNPKPIIILSLLTKEGSKATLEALENGAIDFVTKPGGDIVSADMDNIENELITKIHTVVFSNISKKINKITSNFAQKSNTQIYSKKEKYEGKPDILLIGTSTGGPQALQSIIPKLPKLNIPIVVAQHMPQGFTETLAKTLNKKSILNVKEAQDKEELQKNTVYILPGGKQNTVIQSGLDRIYFKIESNEISKKLHTPSVDLLFESAGKIYQNIVAVVLTGMGKDGLEGTKCIKNKNSYIIAESVRSAVVYGMPKALAEEGLPDEICDLKDVPKKILKLFY